MTSRLAVPVMAFLLAAPPAHAQTCDTVPDPGGVQWQSRLDRYRDLNRLRDSLARTVASQNDGSLEGKAAVFRDSLRNSTRVLYIDLQDRDRLQAAVLDVLSLHLQRRPLAPGNAFVWNLEEEYEVEKRSGTSVLTKCRPDLANRGKLRRLLRRVSESAHDVLGETDTRTVVDMVIDRNGDVAAAVVREPSGERVWDPLALQVAREMEFQPARWNDFPVAYWVRQPITFSAR